MNKQQKINKAQEHERITFAMGLKERKEAFKKKLAEQKAAKELAERRARLEVKRVRGLAHYKSKLELAIKEGRWRKN